MTATPGQEPGPTGAAPSVGVFCASRPHPAYLPLAEDLGRQLARRGAGLVYGGGHAGLMGAVAAGAHEEGGPVTGVVPHDLFQDERIDPPKGQLFLVKSMHDRKELMYRLSDAFVVLPGGLGTLSELSESAEWSQLGIHHRRRRKPVVLLNWQSASGEGFFDGLILHLKRTLAAEFLTAAEHGLIKVASETARALDEIGVPPERTLTAPGGPRAGPETGGTS